MQVLFRTDASLAIGSGHLMRCLTLAQALRQAGHQVYFACRQHPGHLLPLLADLGFTTFTLPLLSNPPQQGYQAWLGCTEAQDASALITCLDAAPHAPVQNTGMFDWLIVDHYGLGATFCQTMRAKCHAVLQIDDLANRQYDCDVLLDQNLLPNFASRYQALLPDHCQPLLGPRFALLRPEFTGVTPTQRQFPVKFNAQSPARLLVFFGGSDEQNFTSLAINALQQLQEPHWLADIVIGQANPHRLLLQQLCAQDRRLTLLVQTPGMAGLMAAADVMIGAGGATHWERACLGLPAIVVALADNQQATTHYLASLGACIDLGPADQLSAGQLAQATATLLNDTPLRTRMSAAAQQLVPAGGGVPHLLQLLQQSTTTHTT
ncbi:MAG: UDP-2,4-diacetamido-2,4,6-trideoxy-beta-L-altropyranose hydrolase [Rheinheimera sp.]|nr:UDP-2,4-diacetamido-2,4,6-trideoxy-beta-L-altropyranose hydrolase [Rheinheimera sp.]